MNTSAPHTSRASSLWQPPCGLHPGRLVQMATLRLRSRLLPRSHAPSQVASSMPVFFVTIRDMKQFLHHIEYSFAQRMISLQVQSCRRHACPCRPFDRFHAPKRSKPPAPPVQEKDASRNGMLLPLPFKVGVPIQRWRPASALPLAIHTVLEFVSRPSIPVVIFFTICHRTPSDPAAVDAAMI